MQTNIIKYGLVAGGIIVMIPVITGWLIGHGPETFEIGAIIGYSTIILSLLLIFIAVNDYQKKHPNEEIGFKKIFLIGAGISAIAGIMFGLYNLVYVYYIAPDFMDVYYGHYMEDVRNSGATATEIELKISQLEQEKEMFKSPVINFLMMFITVFVVGLIVSVVSGLFQKSKLQQSV